jgi:hypothetical protein
MRLQRKRLAGRIETDLAIKLRIRIGGERLRQGERGPLFLISCLTTGVHPTLLAGNFGPETGSVKLHPQPRSRSPRRRDVSRRAMHGLD